MKVYIAMQNIWYEGSYVVRVFKAEEDCQKYVDKMNKEEATVEYDVEEWEVF